MAFRLHTNILDEYDQREIFEFGEQCNYVDYSNDKFCRFLHKNDDATAKILMLIPYEHIFYIERIEDV